MSSPGVISQSMHFLVSTWGARVCLSLHPPALCLPGTPGEMSRGRGGRQHSVYIWLRPQVGGQTQKRMEETSNSTKCLIVLPFLLLFKKYFKMNINDTVIREWNSCDVISPDSAWKEIGFEGPSGFSPPPGPAALQGSYLLSQLWPPLGLLWPPPI